MDLDEDERVLEPRIPPISMNLKIFVNLCTIVNKYNFVPAHETICIIL